MRHVLILFVAAVILVVGAPAGAQTAAADDPPTTSYAAAASCRPFDTPPFVIVTMRDGSAAARNDVVPWRRCRSWRSGGKLSRTPLDVVEKIAEPRDPIWEGPVVGAALGGLFWALCGSDCDAGYMLRATAGLCAYRARPGCCNQQQQDESTKAALRPSLSFRVRF